MTENHNWREGLPSLRQVLLIFGVYAGVLFAVGGVLLLFPIEQRRELWWLGHTLAMLALGYLYAYLGEKGSLVIMFAAIGSANLCRGVKPVAMWLAVAAAVAVLFVGYGFGILVKKRRAAGTIPNS